MSLILGGPEVEVARHFGPNTTQVQALLSDCHDLTAEDVRSLDQAGRLWKRLYRERWIQAAEDAARAAVIEAGHEEALDNGLHDLAQTVPEAVWRDHEDAYDVLFWQMVALVAFDRIHSYQLRILSQPYKRFWRERRPKEEPPPMGI